ncbi:molecular chaperone TorD family protein [Pelagibius sp. Alg239-R121]|uniref:molecular chaperone TorD family protein n=1 Tax=Pelagibius sp. Alg239-R121 TaxID=2993448 RepID=UPI0024A7920B|nr:molecular chaperone TorD family protein [Pelagibius sp. Alg239-R121]
MSTKRTQALPGGNSAERAAAKETIWRLSAIALGHPTPELQSAIEQGSFHEAFDTAWSTVTGRPWPRALASRDFAHLEAGYITAFLHGPVGKPIASLLAGDHESLLAGLSRPVFMLNISAFYRHFGLQAATGDEGRNDEPDHLASMLEFMAVLAHLESRTLARGRDPADSRRAQRDFLQRYLSPLLYTVAEGLRERPAGKLDRTLAQLVSELPDWASGQIAELEARVGPYHDTDAARSNPGLGAEGRKARVIDQNLWG